MADFVLIPGAGGRARYWHRVVPLLQEHGHTAIAVDLPAGDDDAGLARYADTVTAAAVLLLAGGGLVLVASSMGGLVAPLTCDRLPVRQIVLVNAMIPAPGETGGEWWAATGQPAAQRAAAEAAGRLSPGDPDEDEITVFLHDLTGAELAEATRTPIVQSGRPFADPWPLPAWPQVPTRVVAGRGDRLFPPAFQRQVAEQRLRITPDELDAGHLVALSRPRELTAYLLSCLADR